MICCFKYPGVLFGDQGSPSLVQHVVSVESSSLLLYSNLFVYRDVSGIDELEGHHSNRTTN